MILETAVDGVIIGRCGNDNSSRTPCPSLLYLNAPEPQAPFEGKFEPCAVAGGPVPTWEEGKTPSRDLNLTGHP